LFAQILEKHTGIWKDYAGDDFDAMLAGLQGGKDTRLSRGLITTELNAVFPEAPCGD